LSVATTGKPATLMVLAVPELFITSKTRPRGPPSLSADRGGEERTADDRHNQPDPQVSSEIAQS
jgi:hypothetical protein